MSVKEQVVEEIKRLSEAEAEEVAKYLAFLRFRARHTSPVFDESRLAALYAEFAEEDRALAEEGLADYVEDLAHEDAG